MKVFVCTDFLLSHDGITSQRLARGDVLEIPDHMAKGLVFEGYVKEYVEPPLEVANVQNGDAPSTGKADGRRRKYERIQDNA